MKKVTPEDLLTAYAVGVFPMAEDAHDPRLYWVDPERRGIIPLDRFHVPRRLARTLRHDPFEIRIDSACPAVIEACAAPAAGRDGTWINEEIAALYTNLHAYGFVHSVECWREETLVGGLYGVSLGAAFFGESMFSRARNASKVALVHLAGRLVAGGYRLLDVQFVTAHLRQFGAIEVPRREYHDMLGDALGRTSDFYRLPADSSGAAVLQSLTRTS